MSIHTLPWTFEELGRGQNKALEVEFECCVTPGSPGSRWEPPEPTQVEFCDVKIVSFSGAEGEIEVSPSLEQTLIDVAFVLAERDRERLEETLLERIGDAEDAAREE